MGEKGMEAPAPSRSGLVGAAEAMGPVAGVSSMAAGAGGASMAGDLQQAAGGSIGDATLSRPIEQARGRIGQPPKG